KKFIARTGVDEDVFDEAQFFRLMIYSQPPSHPIEIGDTSKGTVDLNIIHPWMSLFFANSGESQINEKIEQTITLGDNVLFSAMTYINGFQSGNTYYAIRADEFVKKGRLIVDFSSLPHQARMHRSPPAAAKRSSKHRQEVAIPPPTEPRPGIFHVDADNLDE